MKVGSVFSGIGGLDKGLEDAGMHVVWQAEINTPARQILHRQFPHSFCFGDAKDVSSGSAGTVDLICGGSPCQDVSQAGKRDGLVGEKSRLFFEFHRILTELKPTWFIFENVPGLLSSNQKRDFAIVLSGFTGVIPELPKHRWKKSGFAFGRFYHVAWRVLDAQYFGVPQRRKRVFIVGCLAASGRSPIEVLFERDGDHWNPPARPKTREGATAVAGTLSASGSGTARTGNSRSELDMLVTPYTLQSFGEYAELNVASTMRARDGKDATDLIAVSLDCRNLQSGGDLSGTLQAKPSGGYSLNYINPVVFLPNASAAADTVAASNTTSPTLKSSGNGSQVPAVTVQTGVRRLTPTECERLQGFPDGWTDGFSDTRRYFWLGNAVATPVGKWIAERVLSVEARLQA
jgi:DNA (cytosine-5)-methyltransferase 1